MKEPKYDIAVVIGRFQPYHNAHHNLLNHALKTGKEVVVILGSAHKAPDTDNPFTPELREKMIRACFDEATNARLSFFGVRDYPYNLNTWICEVQNTVRNVQEDKFTLEEGHEALHNIKLLDIKVALVGYEKDESSFYLKLFPQWAREYFYQNTKEAQLINATDIRDLYLKYGSVPNDKKKEEWRKISDLVPAPVTDFLVDFFGTEQYVNLAAEHRYNEKYKADSQFVGLPFKPTFNTTDCVVTCKGHILLVRRGMNPGKGKIGLPGGFLAEGVTIRANAIKELKEETRINMPAPLLDGLIKDNHVFDSPKRAKRGRVITHAFYIPITIKTDDDMLPLVKGGDDADKAFWLPIAALGENEDKFFEDHIHIIRHFLGVE